MTDAAEHLAERLRALDGQPVSSHVVVLDEVHQGLVGELDRLAGAITGDGVAASTGSSHRQD